MAIVRSDGVLFAKNSDRDPNEAQFLDWQPRQVHPPGARVQCTWIEIPQARETQAVLLSRPFWIWGAEMGTNEHGVTIGNQAVFTRQRYARRGLTGMDLVRLALERSPSAAEAVRTIVGLMDEFGQGGGCGLERRSFTYHNSFMVADPGAAFVLETAGRYHAVEQVRTARSISNGLTIPGFVDRHGDRIKTHFSACRLRQARTAQLVERAVHVADLIGILRDHGHGRSVPEYSWVNGGLRAPCVHAGGFIASSQTTASWVADLRSSGVRHWVTATAAPCTSLFKPVTVEEPLELGWRPTDRAEKASLWWRHEQLHRTMMRDPARLGARYYDCRDKIEAAWLANPPNSLSAFVEHDRLIESWSKDVSAYVRGDARPRFVQRYWAKRNAQAGLQLAGLHTAEELLTR